MKRENFAAAAKLIASSRRILISGHVSPDGDAIGSMIALQLLLRKIGKEAFATADIKSLGKMSFLEGAKEIIPVRNLRRQKPFDLLIAVDNNGFDRMPPEVKTVAENLPILNFDHHITNDGKFGNVVIVDATAASTTQVIWSFAKWNEWPIDTAIAEALWTGLITDSGRFAYDSTSPQTMRAAGDLLKYGVRTAYINDIVYGRYSKKSMELKRLAWKSLHIWKNQRVAEVTLTREDFRAVKGTKADIEDAIEIPRSFARNEIALFFYQIPDRTRETRCSIRTRGDWDSTVLANQFGGGGHKKAAGCTIKSPLATAKRKMRAAVKELLKGG